ncbi:MAG: ABC transporter permease [Acidimicrobiales bacterium]
MTATGNPVIQWSWISQNASAIWSALGQHAELSGIAVGVGFAIALPVSLFVWRFSRARGTVIAFAGLLYTIPSIALFAILQPITGFFTITTAEVALVSYTQLVLIRNIVTGLDEVPPEVREAARAMGYSPVAEFFNVDLPLATPAIIAGLRVATVTVVGLVNVTAFIGLGGLGQFIIQGFQENGFQTPIIVALVLSIALAGLADLFLVGVQHFVVRWNRAPTRA